MSNGIRTIRKVLLHVASNLFKPLNLEDYAWYQPGASREEAVALLMGARPGTFFFIIVISSIDCQ